MSKAFRLVIAAILIFSIHLLAEERDQIEEQQYYKELEHRAPEAVEHFRNATEAMDIGDNETAEQEFEKVLKLAGEYAPALRRMSYVSKDTLEAMKFARRAVAADNHVYNRIALVSALLNLSMPENHQEALITIQECVKEIPQDTNANLLLCQAALVNNKMFLFADTVNTLKRLAPDMMPTHYFSGILAAYRENWMLAEDEILKAVELGLPQDVADNLLVKYGVSSKAKKWRLLTYSFYAVLIWAAILGLLMTLGLVLSKLTIIAVEKMTPEAGGIPSGKTLLIRRMYKIILGMTSVYFYISLPIVMLLVVAAGAGAIYAFVAAGKIPIRLLIFVIIAVLGTLWAILKSLFTRPPKEDPGKPLQPQEAPELFKVLEEVADNVNTRMVDVVFLTPGAEIAVFERGSLWRRFLGKTQSCLILGIGALKGLTQMQFKSILAHEFGHLNNKDTAGGSLALQVRRSTIASMRGLIEGGTAKFYNPAWLFINAFHRIFLRISQGASRLQEVIADRFAALAYGSKNFVQGLTNLIRRSIEFDLITNVEAYQAQLEKRKFNNLYSMDLPTIWPEGKKNTQKKIESPFSPAELVEKEFKKAMETPTSAYDSHPAPQQRIQWVERLHIPIEPHDDGTPALQLINFSLSLQQEMSQQMHENLMKYNIRKAMDEAFEEENSQTLL